MTREIDLLDIERIVGAIIRQAVAKRGSSDVKLRENFYWNISKPQVYDVTTEPTDPDIGSLHDDVEFLKKISLGDQEALANNLIKLSSVIRYVGEILGDELAKDGG